MAGCDNLAICVPAGPDAAAKALAATRQFLLLAGCKDETGAHLAIIVEEIICNIVDHGRPPTDDPIELTFARTARGLRLGVIDGGAFFDPRSADMAGELPPERGGGAGIALIRAWAEILSYERRGARNHLLIELPE
ncbi:ATP-binding protein [Sphingomonas sp. KC8]|uniref:ATP-binding protein n=1 Tax=Sphingomonas sp. KC8 TaxID=1030157 RepID=UPI000248A7F1|nr:ATP-binding protein [Sphingomonas sp. KC8]ARS27024.1 anti-sigma regulatory factor [Sphingomonas sp. KC8]